MKLLLDMDTGVDDAVALALALNSPELDLVAVTTVAGNAPLAECERNTRLLVGLLAPGRLLRVAAGAAAPSVKPLLTAPEVHGEDGLGGARDSLPEPDVALDPTPAAELIVEILRESTEPITIVATGPLTNVARALEIDRGSVARCRRLVVMGGAFAVPGNTGPVAEFNFYVDPEAAEAVMSSGLEITVVPLDATTRSALPRADVAGRPGAAPRPPERPSDAASVLWRALSYYMDYQMSESGLDGGYMHDPIAVAAVIAPSVVKTARGTVTVCVDGPDRGRSAVRPPTAGSPVRVAFDIDERSFLAMLEERVVTPVFGRRPG